MDLESPDSVLESVEALRRPVFSKKPRAGLDNCNNLPCLKCTQ